MRLRSPTRYDIKNASRWWRTQCQEDYGRYGTDSPREGSDRWIAVAGSHWPDFRYLFYHQYCAPSNCYCRGCISILGEICIIFSKSRGAPLRSPYGAGARPCPYPELLRRYGEIWHNRFLNSVGVMGRATDPGASSWELQSKKGERAGHETESRGTQESATGGSRGHHCGMHDVGGGDLVTDDGSNRGVGTELPAAGGATDGRGDAQGSRGGPAGGGTGMEMHPNAYFAYAFLRTQCARLFDKITSSKYDSICIELYGRKKYR